MKTVNQERKVLLRILLFKAVKLVTAFRHYTLKVAGNYRHIWLIPHAFKQLSERKREIAMKPKRILHVELVPICSNLDKILVNETQIGQNLNCRIHIASVTKIL